MRTLPEDGCTEEGMTVLELVSIQTDRSHEHT